MDIAHKTYENLLRRQADRQGFQLVKSRRRDPTARTYDRYLLLPLTQPRPRSVEEAEDLLLIVGLTLEQVAEKLGPSLGRGEQRPDTRTPRTLMKEGARYGHWTVLSTKTIREDHYASMLCRCDCGVERRVRSRNLRTGVSVSCGTCEYTAGRNS